MNKNKIILLTISALSFWSCDNDFENDVTETNITSGTANFSKFVALGNSLTSGYRDGALYKLGQIESYPNMIATQMKLAGGGEFKTPLMSDELGGIPAVGVKDKFYLVATGVPSSPVSPIQNTTISGTSTIANIFSAGPYQNMAVPGAKSFHLVASGYGNPAGLAIGAANPYYVRFSSGATSNLLTDATNQNPTFFSLWIGNNDVLSYATSGGIGIDQKGNFNPATYGSNDITDPTVFSQVYTSMIAGLTAKGAKGVIANLPYVTSIPYFTTVSTKPFAAGSLSSTQISALNQAYAAYNGGLNAAFNANLITSDEAANRKITFTNGVANGAVIEDESLTNLSALGLPSLRMSNANDLILLTASTALRTGGGTSTPLSDGLVLIPSEINALRTTVDSYNTTIKTLASQYNLAFVDANRKMQELSSTSGIKYNGVTYTATFVTGGAFSLDGVHPNGRGYGIIANEFIKSINEKYGSNLPQVNPNSYSGVTFP